MTARTMDLSQACDKAGEAPASPKARRWGAQSKDDPVARTASDRLGLRPKYVEKLLRAKTGLNVRAAELIRAFRMLGDDLRLERFYEPIRRAYENRHPQPLTLQLVESVREACHAEDVAELHYLHSRSDKDLSMEIRALDCAIARMTLLRDAARADEERRMARQS
jgi:hypothetical protein